MVRGPAEQFAYQIERTRFEEDFWTQGSVIKKMQSDGKSGKYGPYAWLVSPPSHGRNWYYLGKYEKEIDIDWRVRMDYHRMKFREWEKQGFPDPDSLHQPKIKKVARDWYLDKEIDFERLAYGFKLDPINEAKEQDQGYKQAFIDTVFSRGFMPRGSLVLRFLEHIQEEIVEIHLDEDIEEIVDLDLVYEKYKEWGKIPSDFDRFKEAVEEGKKPKFKN